MYAVLGDVEFELITYFDGMEAQFGMDYAEHALIGGKPRLQLVGEKLDEFRVELTFHASYCDPEVELVKLRQAIEKDIKHIVDLLTEISGYVEPESDGEFNKLREHYGSIDKYLQDVEALVSLE